MSEDAKQYRRMRDLNNAASKRCRVGRKRKSEVRFFKSIYGLTTWFYEFSVYKSTKKIQMLKSEKKKPRRSWMPLGITKRNKKNK